MTKKEKINAECIINNAEIFEHRPLRLPPLCKGAQIAGGNCSAPTEARAETVSFEKRRRDCENPFVVYIYVGYQDNPSTASGPPPFTQGRL